MRCSRWIVLGMLCLVLGACGTPQPTAPVAPTVSPIQVDTVLVPMSFAREPTTISLTTLDGEIRVRGGATELIQGVITHTVSVVAPSLSAQTGLVGLVQLPGRGVTNTDIGQATNNWDLTMNGTVPIQLGIQSGGHKTDLDVGGMRLQSLTLNEGASTTTINFSQPNPADMRRVQITTGASKLDMLNLFNAHFASLVVDAGAGDYLFDFGGKALRAAQAQFKVAGGNVVIRIPADAGVKVGTTGVTPTVAGDLLRDGGSYITQAWRKSEMLQITVQMPKGNLRIETR